MRHRLALTPLEDRATPATFTVDTLTDVTAADGLTTLREALLAANATPGPDTIAFAPNLAGGTITLTARGLSATGDVTIAGFPADPVAVAGGFAAGAAAPDVLAVQAGATASVSGVRFSNTTPNGHGVLNLGTLTLDRVTVSGVTGGSGFLNAGTATVTNSVFTGNSTATIFEGGGLTNAAAGTLTVRDTRITGNRATNADVGAGGGLAAVGGRVDLTNVTVSGNAAAVGGGGVFVSGGVFTAGGGTRITGNTAKLGGGLAALGLPPNGTTVRVPTVTLTGVTIDGNAAGSGGGVAVAAFDATVFPTVTLANCTITNNTADADVTDFVTLGVVSGVTARTLAVPRGVGGGLAVAGGFVTVTGGSLAGNTATAGGGLGVVLGSLSVTGVSVTGNSAVSGGGAAAFGSSVGTPTVAFTDTTFDANAAAQGQTGSLAYSLPGVTTPPVPRGAGGGLYAAATVTATGGRLAGNRATSGAGAAAGRGTLALTRLTASANTATAGGGGLAVTGGAVTLTDATAGGNRAARGGGLAADGGTVALANSTVAGNVAADSGGGAAVAASGSLTARSSIVAGNAAPVAADVAGTVATLGGNVVGVGDGATGFGPSDQLGTAAAPLDAGLGTLADNGGGTLTFLPAAFSPAVDRGVPTGAPATDQRGQPRVVGAAIDAGAVERQPGDPTPPPPARRPGLPRTFAAGSDAGTPAAARTFNADGTPRLTLAPFAGFTGGVRVATADLTGDGVDDLIVGTGPGVTTRVQVIDGASGATLFDVSPFEASFTGGVFVAVGDLSGDGRADLVVTPDEGGGPVVVAYDGTRLADGAAAQTLRFFGIEDPAFRGGARAAAADVTGDGRADLVVAAGFGGGPRVSVWDGTTAAAGALTGHPFGDFFVFEQTLRNGVYVAAGDLDGDGYAEVVAGGGPGGGPRVFALSGRDLTQSRGGTQTVVANFFAGDATSRGGVRLAAKDLDGDGRADLVAGSAAAAGRVTAFAGKSLAGTPTELLAFDAGGTGGVYVG